MPPQHATPRYHFRWRMSSMSGPTCPHNFSVLGQLGCSLIAALLSEVVDRRRVGHGQAKHLPAKHIPGPCDMHVLCAARMEEVGGVGWVGCRWGCTGDIHARFLIFSVYTVLQRPIWRHAVYGASPTEICHAKDVHSVCRNQTSTANPKPPSLNYVKMTPHDTIPIDDSESC